MSEIYYTNKMMSCVPFARLFCFALRCEEIRRVLKHRLKSTLLL